MEALLLDCDGVLAETERDIHRPAFNSAFAAHGLTDHHWSVADYGSLLAIGGGKERICAWFDRVGWPLPLDDAIATNTTRADLIARLHATKTDHALARIAPSHLAPRPGIPRLIDDALDAGLPVAICSTSQDRTVAAIARAVLGPARADRLPRFAGDCVAAKKPDPAVYLLAARTLGVDPAACLVIEDSAIGLAAARAAGMVTVITPSTYTLGESFAGAALVLPDLGPDDAPRLTLAQARALVATHGR